MSETETKPGLKKITEFSFSLAVKNTGYFRAPSGEMTREAHASIMPNTGEKDPSAAPQMLPPHDVLLLARASMCGQMFQPGTILDVTVKLKEAPRPTPKQLEKQKRLKKDEAKMLVGQLTGDKDGNKGILAAIAQKKQLLAEQEVELDEIADGQKKAKGTDQEGQLMQRFGDVREKVEQTKGNLRYLEKEKVETEKRLRRVDPFNAYFKPEEK